jgi:hypothetical protein
MSVFFITKFKKRKGLARGKLDLLFGMPPDLGRHEQEAEPRR